MGAEHESDVPHAASRKVEPAPGILVRDLGHRVLLFDPEGAIDHELTGSGALVWRSSCERGTDAALAEDVSRQTGPGPGRERALAEARGFVRQLVELGVLRRVG